MKLTKLWDRLSERTTHAILAIVLLILSSIFCWDALAWSAYLPHVIAIPVLHMVAEMAAFGAMFGFCLALMRDAIIDRSKPDALE